MEQHSIQRRKGRGVGSTNLMYFMLFNPDSNVALVGNLLLACDLQPKRKELPLKCVLQ